MVDEAAADGLAAANAEADGAEVESDDLEAGESVTIEDAVDAVVEDVEEPASSDVADGEETDDADQAESADLELLAAQPAAELGVDMVTEGDPVPLEAGDYIIRTGLGGAFVLDVEWGTTANGGNVQIYTYNASNAQKWHVAVDGEGNYTITNAKSGKALDLSGAYVANGSNIQQYTSNKTTAQKWILKPSGDGFVIVSALDVKYALDISGGRAADGSNVQLWKANNTAAQMFIFSPFKAAASYDAPLADGEYIIQSRLGGQYVLDVAWGSTANGANVQIYSYNGTNAQKWQLSHDESGLYTIMNVASKKALDLSGAQAWYGSNVQQYNSNKTKAQKWVITAQDGSYKIASAVDPLFVLDISGGWASNGSNVQVYFDNGTSAQRFSFTSTTATVPTSSEIADGVYSIASFSNKKYLVEVSGGSASNSANVQLYTDNDSNAQRWGIVRNGDGLYSVFNMVSGKMLDVAGGNPLAGANLQQYASNDTKAQQWSIVKASDGSFTIYSALSGLAVDISGGKIAKGSNVQLYTPNESAAQKFALVSKPLIEERTYSIISTLGNGLAVDVPNGSRDDGKALQVYGMNDTMAQHVVVRSAEDGNYMLQVVVSGKYLTAQGNSVVQKSNASDPAQMWKVSLVKGGVVFTNASTGKAMAVSSSKPKNGTSLGSASSTSATSKFGLRNANLISDGMYTIVSTASPKGRVLDVSTGSWNNGTNVQLYSSNNTNAQKFLIKHIEDGYYRILMAPSSQAVEVAGGSKKDNANVSIFKWNGTDGQLWKLTLEDTGFSFVNKYSGLRLAVAGGVDKDGTNVNQQSETNAYLQTWLLAGTSINAGDLNTLTNLVRSVSGASTPTASWTVDPNAWNGLMKAVRNVWNAGYDVGFIMTDLQTGNSVSLNADKNYYGACTIKAAYITWIMQELVDPGYVSLSHVYDRMYPAIHDSENSTYLSLRAEYGNDGFTRWLGDIGLSGGWTYENYAFYSPRTLQLMWTRMTAYDASNGKNVGTWRSLLGNTNWTPIAYELRGNENIVYSKPGWYSGGGAYQTLADSGLIVRPDDGRKYLLTIMGTYNPDDYGIGLERAIARALDNVIRSAPAA